MNKHHPHNNFIEKKLEQLSSVNADHLWNDMHSILDKQMPQKKERRRFIVWWFLSGKGLLLLTVVVFMITASSLFFLSKKESAAITIEKLPGSSQSDKPIENDTVKASSEGNENITTAIESNKEIKNGISAAAQSSSAVDQVINDRFITEQTKKQSKKYVAKEQLNQAIPVSEKYTSKEQFNQPIQDISKHSTNFDIAPVNLESIHRGLVNTTNHNEEKKWVSPQLEPVATKVKLNPRNNNESGFYAGIISGIDLSSIRFKSIRTGSTKGFIIGYAVNKKWSIESGLLWDTKRVYDNGKNFHPPGYTPTNGITIVDVNGKSRLYELPVNMKYTIISGKQSLFTTAGLSSYIMRSETYDYKYEQNNQPGGHNYLSYTNATKNWFSIVNFSVGYIHKLGDFGSIRVEPYVKLPLKNLGVANMPITSTGLNIGFTKPLRR